MILRFLRPASLLSHRYVLLLTILFLLSLSIPFSIAFWWSIHGIPYDDLHNLVSPHVNSGLGISSRTITPPPLIPELLGARHMSSFRTPSLIPPNCSLPSRSGVNSDSGLTDDDDESSLPPSTVVPARIPESQRGSALLMLHFFSTAKLTTLARARRDLIRRTIYRGVPHKYRRFVEVRFVIGRSWDPAVQFINEKEEKRYKDFIQLALPEGESERGKVVQWVKEVRRLAEDEEGRRGLWVVKCEDDVSFLPGPARPVSFLVLIARFLLVGRKTLCPGVGGLADFMGRKAEQGIGVVSDDEE